MNVLFSRPILLRPFISSRSNHRWKTTDRRKSFGDIRKQNSNSITFGALCLLAVPAGTFCLGVWQYNRRNWKLELLEQIENAKRSTPVPLLECIEELKGVEYRPIVVTGQFDHNKEMYIGPRSNLLASSSDESNSGGGIISSASTLGYLVVTPFILKEDGRRILINRGWVPKSHLNPETRKGGQVSGEIQVVGYLRQNEPRADFFAPKTLENRTMMLRNVSLLADVLDTEPIYIDANADSSVSDGPIGGQTLVKMPNDHFSYMLTWFSLSGATAFMWVRRYFFNKW